MGVWALLETLLIRGGGYLLSSGIGRMDGRSRFFVLKMSWSMASTRCMLEKFLQLRSERCQEWKHLSVRYVNESEIEHGI